MAEYAQPDAVSSPRVFEMGLSGAPGQVLWVQSEQQHWIYDEGKWRPCEPHELVFWGTFVYVVGFGERGEGVTPLGVAGELDQAVMACNRREDREAGDELSWTRDSKGTTWTARRPNGVDQYVITKVRVYSS